MGHAIPSDILATFTPKAQQCIRTLSNYSAVPDIDCGNAKQAAVLIALFELPDDLGLRVVLTTRAMTLRSHPNQTAFPGGRVDATDRDADHTARREAFEEVDLPLGDVPHLHKLTELEPFLSKYKIIVFPIIYLISSPHLITSLHPSPAEVSAIFSLPLEYALDGVWRGEMGELAEKGGVNWPYGEEFYNHSDTPWLKDSEYRMNRLRTTNTPLKGLTADILLSLSSLTFSRPSPLPRFAPKQLPFAEAIRVVVADSKLAGNEKAEKDMGARGPPSPKTEAEWDLVQGWVGGSGVGVGEKRRGEREEGGGRESWRKGDRWLRHDYTHDIITLLARPQ